MAYGKLAVIKSYGEKPTFVLLDRNKEPFFYFPDPTDWLMKKLGHMVMFTSSGKSWQVEDKKIRDNNI